LFKNLNEGMTARATKRSVSRMRERLVRAVDPGAMTQRLTGSGTFRLDDFSFGHKVLKPFSFGFIGEEQLSVPPQPAIRK
jgi:hypothetical protein